MKKKKARSKEGGPVYSTRTWDGRHTVDRKNRFIAILVYTLSFVVFIICQSYSLYVLFII